MIRFEELFEENEMNKIIKKFNTDKTLDEEMCCKRISGSKLEIINVGHEMGTFNCINI
jgi:hypothetical protein